MKEEIKKRVKTEKELQQLIFNSSLFFLLHFEALNVSATHDFLSIHFTRNSSNGYSRRRETNKKNKKKKLSSLQNWWWRNGICYVQVRLLKALKSCANLARHFHKAYQRSSSCCWPALKSRFHIYNLLKSWNVLVPKDIFLFCFFWLHRFGASSSFERPQKRWRKIFNKRFFRKIFEIFLLPFHLFCAFLNNFSLLHKALRSNAQNKNQSRKTTANKIYSLLGPFFKKKNVLCLFGLFSPDLMVVGSRNDWNGSLLF